MNKNENNPIAYAACSLNETTRMASSSGGIFSLLAEYILSLNGVVYGVTMSEDCRKAEFVRINCVDDLSKLRGSKYLQAQVGDTFDSVKVDLDNLVHVLFTGTGCQVNGLKMYLGKDYENLFCVDVICHGVPSPKLWRQYVEYIERRSNSSLIQIDFRCKVKNWTDFGVRSVFSDKQFFTSKNKDPYMQMFLRNYSLRPSCYACVVKQVKKADLTIADFWGIEKVAPEINDNKGTSLVLIRTSKGQEIFENIRGKMWVQEVAYEDGVRDNPSEYSSVECPAQRSDFFRDMEHMDFPRLQRKYVSEPFKLKRAIKAILLRTPVRKFLESGSGSNADYGMHFIMSKNRK